MKKKYAIFRKNDLFLIIGILALAAVLLLLFFRQGTHDGEMMLEITVGSEVYGTYPLDEDREIRIGGTNTVTIKAGKVEMTEADCPDRLCVRSGSIDSWGESIVCLPNRVVLKITGAEKPQDAPDAIAG